MADHALSKMVRYVLDPVTSEAGARCQDKNVSSRKDTFFFHLDEQAMRRLGRIEIFFQS
jgi:hypothetical protein